MHVSKSEIMVKMIGEMHHCTLYLARLVELAKSSQQTLKTVNETQYQDIIMI